MLKNDPDEEMNEVLKLINDPEADLAWELSLYARIGRKDIVVVILQYPSSYRNAERAIFDAREKGYNEIATLIENAVKDHIAQLEDGLIEKINRHPFSMYALTLRKTPTQSLYLKYLNDLSALKKDALITQPEVEQVVARKLWTDIVSQMNTINQKDSVYMGVKKEIFDKLRNIRPTADLEQLYNQCINYIQEKTVITVTFKSWIFNEVCGSVLEDVQLLNIHEVEPFSYKIPLRNNTELGAFNRLDDFDSTLHSQFLENKKLRPCYGALMFTGGPIKNIRSFGDSFIVLKDVVKLNALFAPADTHAHKVENGTDLYLCSFLHLEHLLRQIDLKQIVQLIIEGADQDLSLYEDMNRNYMEVMLPAINLLDANLVEAIYLAPERKVLPEVEKIFKERGIGIYNTNVMLPKNHTPAYKQKIQAIREQNDEQLVLKPMK